MTYGYDDVGIVPARLSRFVSRSEVNPRYGGSLPIFTAPMDSVVNMENLDLWSNNGIIPIIPRNIPFDTRLRFLNERCNWVAVSEREFKDIFCTKDNNLRVTGMCSKFHVLIDVANGHRNIVLDLVKQGKELAQECGYEIEVMCGNIANPYTYIDYCEAGVDYVRLSIGSGQGCLTSSNVGTHYGIASLIDDVKQIKTNRETAGKFCTKIIADGGIRSYKHINIALALGADYVMIGGLFGKFFESASPIENMDFDEHERVLVNGVLTDYTKSDLLDEYTKRQFIKQYELLKGFKGMSTKEAQLLINPNATKLKTSEGKCMKQKVMYTMEQWAENYEDYLRSLMSYTNASTLEELKNNCTVKLISNSVKNSINQ